MRFPALAFLAALAASFSPALSAFTLTGYHWTRSPITMQLQLGTTTGPLSDGSSSWGASAEDAFNTWNGYIGATRFAVVRDSTAPIAQGNGYNNVFFGSTVYGQAWGTGVLAVTLTFSSNGTQTSECDVLFNNTLQWDSYRGNQRYNATGTVFDFHRVALHEFGHVLGLDHPDQGGQTVTAIMNSRISNLDALAADDVAGAQSLYGANTSTTPAVTAPQITSQPASQTVAAGASVSFSVAASGTAPLTYQWFKDSGAIAGATSTSLTVPGVTTSSAGSYWVTVTNSAGSVTSTVATLAVTTPATAPTITRQPASLTAAPGTTVSFSVTASGTAPLTYAWRKNGAAISGATQAMYTLAPVQSGSAGSYSVVVSNVAGSVTSASATLTVTSVPVFTTQPVSQTATLGSTVSFSAAASGMPAPALQWFRNGAAVTGATNSTYAIASVTTLDAGSYVVTATNSSGSATSATAVLGINAAPMITTAPLAQTISAGGRLTLSVAASGTPAPAYQWQKNGVNLAGATQANLVVPAATVADTGSYDVVITNLAGTVTTAPVQVTVNGSKLVNLSTRGYLPAGGALTAGFVLRGAAGSPVIVRGIGPALDGFGVTNALADPQLALISQDTAETLTTADSWSAQLSPAFQSVGAFALTPGSPDSASELQLAPGAYTTRVSSDSSGGGVALAEVYDGDPSTASHRLINLSTLGFAGTGDQSLVAGFSIQGPVAKRVLLRAIGPGLVPYGVTGLLANPRLDVYPLGQSSAIAGNDDWSGTTDLATAFNAVGAFQLTPGSRDAALVLTLAPGGYTVVVSGVGSTTGVVLVEIYDLDP